MTRYLNLAEYLWLATSTSQRWQRSLPPSRSPGSTQPLWRRHARSELDRRDGHRAGDHGGAVDVSTEQQHDRSDGHRAGRQDRFRARRGHQGGGQPADQAERAHGVAGSDRLPPQAHHLTAQGTRHPGRDGGASAERTFGQRSEDRQEHQVRHQPRDPAVLGHQRRERAPQLVATDGVGVTFEPGEQARPDRQLEDRDPADDNHRSGRDHGPGPQHPLQGGASAGWRLPRQEPNATGHPAEQRDEQRDRHHPGLPHVRHRWPGAVA